jgi:hypothetical protein
MGTGKFNVVRDILPDQVHELAKTIIEHIMSTELPVLRFMVTTLSIPPPISAETEIASIHFIYTTNRSL